MLMAFMLGVTGSLGHCVGMCGPAAALLARGRARSAVIFLHLGRLATYTLLGLLAGALGQAAGLGISLMRQLQGALALAAAHAAVYFALAVLGWAPSPERLLAPLVSRWGGAMRAQSGGVKGPGGAKGRGWASALTLGMLWGLLPCGMVIAALFTALTSADALGGALRMAAFGLGTLPALLAVRWLAGRVLRLRWPRYAAASLLLLFGAQLALRGLAAWGVVSHLMVGEVMVW